jgi:hypothetical protein
MSDMSPATRELASVIQPLTDREERSAIDAATAALHADLSERYRVFGTELRIDKRVPEKIPDRLIGVYIVDYVKHRSIEALVDQRGKVVAVNDLPQYQVPISREEIREAEEIAARDEHVAQALKRHTATFVSPYVPHDHTSKKRIIGLHYFRSDPARPLSPCPVGDVEVDLAARTVRFTAIQEEGK